MDYLFLYVCMCKIDISGFCVSSTYGILCRA